MAATARTLNVRRVAVIGAGVSGVAAAVHLKRAGLDITVYERSAQPGGIWLYDERSPRDPAYPAVLPSVGDSPEYETIDSRVNALARHDSPLGTPGPEVDGSSVDEAMPDNSLSFAPPGPAYVALKNNVSTIEMELSIQAWKPGTEEFVPHPVLLEYIQDAVKANGIEDIISLNTRVNRVEKTGGSWRVDIAKLDPANPAIAAVNTTEYFDALVVASGHYHAPNVPDLPGLSEWKRRFPERIQHSKGYRRPHSFQGQNVLIIGAGVSSMDIARDLAGHAQTVYQSSRSGQYDLPPHLLPDNAARVGGISRFDLEPDSPLAADDSIPGTVTLIDGQKLCGLHRVILATGYHVSFSFMRQYHADGVRPEDAGEEILVTNGQVTHNLHKDIFAIFDPTLAFIGVPYHAATYTLFEFQAMAVAQVFAGRAPLPSREDMRREYLARIGAKGTGRNFHSLKAPGAEIEYVQDLIRMGADSKDFTMTGHTDRWLEAHARRGLHLKAMFSQQRDPAIDEQVLSRMSSC